MARFLNLYPERIAVTQHPENNIMCIEIIVTDVAGKHRGIVHIPIGSWFYLKLAGILNDLEKHEEDNGMKTWIPEPQTDPARG